MFLLPYVADGDAANEEKIWTTVKEKEKERARMRTTRWTAIARRGVGAKTTMMEVAVEAMVVFLGGVDTGAATTVTTAMMVTATTMT